MLKIHLLFGEIARLLNSFLLEYRFFSFYFKLELGIKVILNFSKINDFNGKRLYAYTHRHTHIYIILP